jgi:hypothetical protein
MRFPWANIVLLALLALQLATGFLGLISGSPRLSSLLNLHGVAGYAIVVILVWKGRVILDALTRRGSYSASQIGFVLMTAILVGLLATGLTWTYWGPIYVLGLSLMTIHALLALGLVLLLVWHIVAKWFVFRIPHARDRRTMLRFLGTTAAGLALWRAAEPAKAALDVQGAMRRFTGSYESGSSPGTFPVVSWLLDYPRPIAVTDWRLVIDGAVEDPLELTYADMGQWAIDEITETLDCTGGWYTTQEWRGVRVERLLDLAGVSYDATSVTVEAVSGYGRRFGVDEIKGYILATHVAGAPLDHGHGAPLRLVAPGHRGYDWVKWVTRLHVNVTSKLWQPPVPLQ